MSAQSAINNASSLKSALLKEQVAKLAREPIPASVGPTTARPKPFGLPAPGGMIDRTPPWDESAEAGLLGSMIIDPECIGPCMMFVKSAEYFFQESNGMIFAVLASLFEKNTPIDALVLHSTLKTMGKLEWIGGIEYIRQLVEAVPTSAHAEYYAVIVREKWMRRRLISASTATLRDCYDTADMSEAVVDRAEQRVFAIAQDKVSSGQHEALPTILESTFDMLQSGGRKGIETGLAELDALTNGLQRGEMIIIAARPSVGKTAFALGIVEHVGVDLGIPCGVFSLEMSKAQLAERMLCSRAGIDSHKLRKNMLSTEERGYLRTAVTDLAAATGIYIDDAPALSITDLRTRARRMKLKLGIELLVIDYLQLMEAPGKSENRQQEITTISRGVKAISRELDIPVLCLSQLNRSSETEQRMPRTSDLRESGSIEQDADTVMLLHREAVFHRGDHEWMDANPDKVNEAIVNVAKQRNGPCDVVKLTFISKCTKFGNYRHGI
jgi:replicative DNA helicase